MTRICAQLCIPSQRLSANVPTSIHTVLAHAVQCNGATSGSYKSASQGRGNQAGRPRTFEPDQPRLSIGKVQLAMDGSQAPNIPICKRLKILEWVLRGVASGSPDSSATAA